MYSELVIIGKKNLLIEKCGMKIGDEPICIEYSREL